MKLVTYHSDPRGPRAGLAIDGRIHDIADTGHRLGMEMPATVAGILALESDARSSLDAIAASIAGSGEGIAEASARLGAALPDPATLYMLAANYQAHIVESGMAAVDKATITPRPFIKPGSAVIGPGDPIPMPIDSDTLDYEIEIAAVIGRHGKHIAAADALAHVAGYVVFNDVSARSLKIAQGRSERNGDWFFDWLLGKWCDGFAVIGPYLVTPDEAGDPNRLEMELTVNGERRQHSSAGEMIFTIPEAIAFLSRFVTLRPGDVISMGTPGGVGYATARYLAPGDVVEARIEGLGSMRNPVVAAG